MRSASTPPGGVPLDRADLERLVLEILTAAATAHGIHEAEDLGGVRDEEWPAWYTQHMVDDLVRGGYSVTREPAADSAEETPISDRKADFVEFVEADVARRREAEPASFPSDFPWRGVRRARASHRAT